jgi:hypothetical protein
VSLFDAFRRALTGRTAWGERGLRRPMADLERLHGSAKAAARATGVSPSTWWRWKTGRAQPRSVNRQRLVGAQRRAHVPAGTRRRALRSTGAAGGLTVTGYDSYDNRDRTLPLGRLLPAGATAGLVAAFEAGDDAAARAELTGRLEQAGYPQHMADTIDNPQINFE